MKKIYQKKEYSIYKVSNGFVVHNTKKKFEEGHTHVSNYYFAKKLIHISITKELPSDLKEYAIVSLIRLTKDSEFKNRLAERSGINGKIDT